MQLLFSLEIDCFQKAPDWYLKFLQIFSYFLYKINVDKIKPLIIIFWPQSQTC